MIVRRTKWNQELLVVCLVTQIPRQLRDIIAVARGLGCCHWKDIGACKSQFPLFVPPFPPLGYDRGRKSKYPNTNILCSSKHFWFSKVTFTIYFKRYDPRHWSTWLIYVRLDFKLKLMLPKGNWWKERKGWIRNEGNREWHIHTTV